MLPYYIVTFHSPSRNGKTIQETHECPHQFEETISRAANAGIFNSSARTAESFLQRSYVSYARNYLNAGDGDVQLQSERGQKAAEAWWPLSAAQHEPKSSNYVTKPSIS